MNPDHKINTPIGMITVPGFQEVEALSDDELVQAMNSAPFVDPVMFQVASRRFSLVHDYCRAEGRWRWWTKHEWDSRPAESRSFTSIIEQLAAD